MIHRVGLFCLLWIFFQETLSLPSTQMDVSEGASIKIECRFGTGFNFPNLALFWTRSRGNSRDNAAIRGDVFNPRYSVDFSVEEGKYDLYISRANFEEDNAEFECFLKETGSGKDIMRKSYRLTVLVPPGEPQISALKPVAREGKSFTISCSSMGGSPDPLILWSKNGVAMHGQTHKSGARNQTAINTLTFVPKMEDDNSSLKCSVYNRAIKKGEEPETSVSLRVQYAPRITVGPYNPLTVLADLNADLTCNVLANPPVYQVKWLRDNNLLSTSLNHTIHAVTRQDNGVYRCIADNGIGEAVHEDLQLSVLYGPIVKVIEEKEVSEGESIEIKCEVESNPPAIEHTWIKEDDLFFQQPGNILRLPRVLAKDSGKYTCLALTVFQPSGFSNQAEASGNASVLIHVRHKPGKTSIIPSTTTAIAGRPFTLSCVADPPGWPKPEFKWWKDEDNKNELSRRANFSLMAPTVTQEGHYFCQPFNSFGEGSIASTFLVVNEPLTMLEKLPAQAVKREEDIGFSVACQAKGKPQPRVRWLKDGVDISETSGLYVVISTDSHEYNGIHTVQSTLRFEGNARRNGKLSYADRGKYVCQFDNGLDEMTKSEMLLRIQHSPIVQHKHNRVAYDQDEMAVLQCKMQAYPTPSFEWYTHNRLVENFGNYQLNVTDDGNDVYTTTLIVKKLDPEQDYGDYTCKASNRIGDYKKTIIRLVKKSAPEKPINLQAVDVHSDRLTLQWSEGFNGGFANTEYLVTYTNQQTMQARNESCRSRNLCDITGLSSKTDYKMKVIAVNSRGYSEYSDEIMFTTKVSLADLPRATVAQYDEHSHYVYFNFEPSSLNLVARLEGRLMSGDWEFIRTVPAFEQQAFLPPPPGKMFSDVRVILCLESNDSWCGDEKLASFSQGLLPFPNEARAAISTEYLITIVIVCAIIFIAALVGLCCCLKRKNTKEHKKDYTMKTPNIPPQIVSPPSYFSETPTYNTRSTTPIINSQFPTETDTYKDSWVKTPPPLPEHYQPYDPSSCYIYTDNFHAINEDDLNLRNRDYQGSHYYDVSGLPDPYAAVPDEEKINAHISFDESLESGYSTPNSRARRIIREIIV